MIIHVTITDDQVPALVRYAIIKGFLREDARPAWTDRDRRTAVKYALDRFVESTQ